MTNVATLQAALAEAGVEALLVGSPLNRRYLSGFTGTAGYLYITENEQIFITDFRYLEQAAQQAPGWQVVRLGRPAELPELVRRLCQERGIRKLGFERDHQTVGQLLDLQQGAPSLSFVPTQGLVEHLRLIKSDDELALIRRAADIADEAFAALLPHIQAGVSEADLALELEYQMRRRGAEGAAFHFIVASGPRGAMPHGVASAKRIEPGELVTFDFGARYMGYHSDITRTVAIGDVNERQRSVYNAVLQAEERALAAVRPGAVTGEVDAVARAVLAEVGLAEYFGHGLGHGVGLDIHEGPRLAKDAQDVLAPGMVVTIEPGVYISGWGGVRIEDLVVVREGGCEVLSHTPKELLVL